MYTGTTQKAAIEPVSIAGDAYGYYAPSLTLGDYEIRIDPAFAPTDYSITIGGSIAHGTVTADAETANYEL